MSFKQQPDQFLKCSLQLNMLMLAASFQKQEETAELDSESLSAKQVQNQNAAQKQAEE